MKENNNFINKDLPWEKSGDPKGYSREELKDKLENNKGLDKEFALYLIEGRMEYKVIDSLRNFSGLDQDVAFKLIEAGWGDVVAHNLGKFEGINHLETALKLIEIGKGDGVAGNLKNFQGLDNEIAIKLIESNFRRKLPRDLDNFLGKFHGLSHQEIALKSIENSPGYKVAHNLDKFSGPLDYLQIALKLINSDQGDSVAFNLEKFEGLDHLEIALKLIELGKGDSLANNLEKFAGINHQEIASKLLEAGRGDSVAHNIKKFKGIDRDLGEKLIDSLLIDNDYSSSSSFGLISEVNNYFKPHLDKFVSKTEEIFGSFADLDSYLLIKKVGEGDDDIIKELKIKKGGNDGLREIREKISDFKNDVISEDFNPQYLLEEENRSVYLPYFKKYIRFEESEWGDSDEDSLVNIIRQFLDYKGRGELKPLNPEFVRSEVLSIKKSDVEAREKYEFNEHFLKRFNVLINSIKESKKLYNEKFPLSNLVKKIEEKRTTVVDELKEKYEGTPDPRAREAINNKIKLLESINVRNVKSFQDNFSILAKVKEFNELLRQVVFLISFTKNKQSLNYNLDFINKDKPSLNDISWVLNFIDHITNQEVVGKYLTDHKASKSLREITSTKAISEEMSLMQKQGSDSGATTKLQFIPTRGILAEFSGDISDSCWTSKYDSVLKEFPNFTPIIIRQNPETKHERLAGAFMLIETKSEEGRPLLVVRGLNPIENVINSVSVDDFYKKTIEYTRDLAKKTGREVAIVIDNHCGGAATNRPALYQYLESLSSRLEPVVLNSKDDTYFNDYDIVDSTYLVKGEGE